MRCCPTQAHFNLVPSDPDLIAIPDFSSFVRLPWRPEIGWVASNLYLADEPFPQSPRLVRAFCCCCGLWLRGSG